MLVVAVLFFVVLALSVRGLRAAGGPRWPFLIAASISGVVTLAVVTGSLTAAAAGRDTWNRWVSGTELSETVTLWLVLVVGPALLATSCALLLTGSVLRARRLHRPEHGTFTASR